MRCLPSSTEMVINLWLWLDHRFITMETKVSAGLPRGQQNFVIFLGEGIGGVMLFVKIPVNA